MVLRIEKKTVKTSFQKMLKRLKDDYESKGKTQTTEYSNLLTYEQVVK